MLIEKNKLKVRCKYSHSYRTAQQYKFNMQNLVFGSQMLHMITHLCNSDYDINKPSWDMYSYNNTLLCIIFSVVFVIIFFKMSFCHVKILYLTLNHMDITIFEMLIVKTSLSISGTFEHSTSFISKCLNFQNNFFDS